MFKTGREGLKTVNLKSTSGKSSICSHSILFTLSFCPKVFGHLVLGMVGKFEGVVDTTHGNRGLGWRIFLQRSVNSLLGGSELWVKKSKHPRSLKITKKEPQTRELITSEAEVLGQIISNKYGKYALKIKEDISNRKKKKIPWEKKKVEIVGTQQLKEQTILRA